MYLKHLLSHLPYSLHPTMLIVTLCDLSEILKNKEAVNSETICILFLGIKG